MLTNLQDLDVLTLEKLQPGLNTLTKLIQDMHVFICAFQNGTFLAGLNRCLFVNGKAAKMVSLNTRLDSCIMRLTLTIQLSSEATRRELDLQVKSPK